LSIAAHRSKKLEQLKVSAGGENQQKNLGEKSARKNRVFIMGKFSLTFSGANDFSEQLLSFGNN